MSRLVQEAELEALPVVANCRMNRGRGLSGVNSYSKDLGVDPLSLLPEEGAWLDLCCGQGLALAQASQLCSARLVGVDLIEGFAPATGVRFHVGSLREFRADGLFDLITCVHGLHYLGDKLGLLERASRWVRPGGELLAHLDLNNLRDSEGKTISRSILRSLRDSGYQYDRNRRLLRGGGHLTFDWVFLGADPKAGPNSTGQPAVNSHYKAALPV